MINYMQLFVKCNGTNILVICPDQKKKIQVYIDIYTRTYRNIMDKKIGKIFIYPN